MKMRAGGALIWLLAAVCLSTIQPAATSLAQLTVSSAVDSDPGGTTATTTTVAVTVMEATTTDGDGRFCNETVSYSVKTDCKPCFINAELGCPDGLLQLSQVLRICAVDEEPALRLREYLFSDSAVLKLR